MQAKDEMEAIKNLNEKVAGIIETITNANGTAIKFADGTMICRGGFSVPANTSEKEVNLPASFIDVNFTVIVTNKYAFTNNTLFSINIIKKEAFNAFPYRVGEGGRPSAQTDGLYIAIGRWK